MNKIRKNTLCLCMAVMLSLLLSIAVYAENYEFKIDGPTKCGVGDNVEVTVTLSSDEQLADSDAFLVYNTEYFNYVDSEADEYDVDNGTVRLRGNFSEDAYGCTWTVTLKAIEEGNAEFEITDKWVKSAAGSVVTSTSEVFTMEIGEAGEEGSENTEDEPLASAVLMETSYSFHFTEPEEIPGCFEESSADISGVKCKVWNFNSKMEQDVNYSAKPDEFFAVYGYIDNENDACWYVYDTETESFSRLLMLQDVKVEKTPEPVEEVNEEKEASPAIINNVTQLMIIALVVLIVLIIVVNVIFNNIEKKSRRKRVEERQRLSHEELRKKRELENKIREKKEQEAQSQNMRRPK